MTDIEKIINFCVQNRSRELSYAETMSVAGLPSADYKAKASAYRDVLIYIGKLQNGQE